MILKQVFYKKIRTFTIMYCETGWRQYIAEIERNGVNTHVYKHTHAQHRTTFIDRSFQSEV